MPDIKDIEINLNKKLIDEIEKLKNKVKALEVQIKYKDGIISKLRNGIISNR